MVTPPGNDNDSVTLHATSVAWQERAALLTGASGTGKSALALQLVSLGATLVSDDRTILTHRDGTLTASAPDSIAGLIEARHVGLLRLPYLSKVRVSLAVDLDQPETDRLPVSRSIAYLGVAITLVRRVDRPDFPAALLHCMTGARIEP